MSSKVTAPLSLYAARRPVGVAVDRAGALLVADDVGHTIRRLIPQ